MHLMLQNVQLTLSSPSGDESRFFSSCSGVGSASPQISFPKTYMNNNTKEKWAMFKRDSIYIPKCVICGYIITQNK